ncbi:MAG: hypothetical protein WKG06_04340 [Segetibacter sp.]
MFIPSFSSALTRASRNFFGCFNNAKSIANTISKKINEKKKNVLITFILARNKVNTLVFGYPVINSKKTTLKQMAFFRE